MLGLLAETILSSSWKEHEEFVKDLDVTTALIADVGVAEEIGTSLVTNVGKNLVNSTSNDSL